MDAVVELQNEIVALRARVAQLEAEQQVGVVSVGADITEHLNTYDAMLRSEARFKAIFDGSGLGVSLVDADGHILAANQALCRLLGYTEEEMRRLHFADFTHPDDVDRDWQLFDELLNGQRNSYQLEKRYRRREGGEFWVRLTVSLIQGSADAPQVVGMVEDISAAKQIQHDLEVSKQRFEQLANNIHDVFWIFDRVAGQVVYVSPAFTTVWGYTPEELYARQEIFVAAIHAEDRQLAFSSLQEQAEGRQTEREYRIVQPDGSIRYIWDRGFPIKNEAGEVVSVAGIASDITEPKMAAERIRQLNETLEQRVQERTEELTQALAQLAEQRDFLHQIMESMAEGVLVYDAARNIEYVNPFIVELTGMSAEEIAVALLNTATIVEETDTFQQQLESRTKGASGTYEIHIRTKRGEKKYIRMSATPRMVNGQFAGGIVVASDLTKRRKAEENLRATSETLVRVNAELEAAARMKDEFLANVSHELRTPLTGILALAEALLANTYGVLSGEIQRPIQMIEESGRHLLSLINDVLDVAKVEAGSLELDLKPVQVDEVSMASLRMVREIAVRRRQAISFSMDPAGIVLQADTRRLTQILVNLLGNAVKFTPEGGQLGLIVQGDAVQQTVTFSVWDNGIGIPAEKLPQLFQPFMQVQSEFNRAYGGTGLGLALVERLAVLHGGSVSVRSEPHKGSRFDVVLPWKTGDGASEPAADAETTGGEEAATNTFAPTPTNTPTNTHASRLPGQSDGCSEPESFAKSTILLVEDNSVTRGVLADFLEMQGYVVLQASDGAQAVHLAAECKPSLVMMDIQMPGMDGVEAIRRIRSLDDPAVAAVPIVALTAHAMHGAREQFMEAGADSYLSKPLRLADLRSCVAEHLSKEQVQSSH